MDVTYGTGFYKGKIRLYAGKTNGKKERFEKTDSLGAMNVIDIKVMKRLA